ncbi:MAG: 4-hydroxy-tetrahydrodipicolinate reductase [Methylosarcina sp.]
MTYKTRIGLIGYGKTGKAVANVLSTDSRFELCWIARRTSGESAQTHPDTAIPVIGMEKQSFEALFDRYPVDAVVDFSSAKTVRLYGEIVRKYRIILVSAISSYSEKDLAYVRGLGRNTRVMCSPNITLGINFLMVAANLLRKVAPFADVEIIEQHFKEKPEVSGTALKIAENLGMEGNQVTSLRLGGIIGEHEVIFGFPHQTVRLSHSSIRREAFGTGAAFALSQLTACPIGFYTFEDLLMQATYQDRSKQLNAGNDPPLIQRNSILAGSPQDSQSFDARKKGKR